MYTPLSAAEAGSKVSRCTVPLASTLAVDFLPGLNTTPSLSHSTGWSGLLVSQIREALSSSVTVVSSRGRVKVTGAAVRKNVDLSQETFGT